MSWFPSLKALGGTRGTAPRTKSPALTLADLKSGKSRFIETYPYDYGSIIAASDPNGGWLKTPLTPAEKEAGETIIVGCGLSGLFAARELLRAGLKVTMYDRGQLDNDDNDWTRAHYGRACSDIRKFPGKPDVVCELGGMRFPEKAKATWQFFSEVFKDTQLFEPFPNPGIVPTALTSQNTVHLWKAGSVEHPDLPPEYRKVAGDVATAMNGITDDRGTTTGHVQTLLGKDTLTPAEEAQLRNYWEYAVANFDNLTFGAWVHEHVEKPNGWTPEHVSIFFNLGFGTGGMGSLFPVGFLEMLRIWIWDYADEYALPAGWGLGTVARKIMADLKAKYPSTLTVHERHEVHVVGYTADPKTAAHASPAILVADLSKPQPIAELKRCGFLILAVPHTALVSMTSLTCNTSYPMSSSRATTGTPHRGEGLYSYFDNEGYFEEQVPAAVKSKVLPLKTAIGRLNMVNASKSFFAFNEAPWYLHDYWSRVDGEPVKCVLSDGWPRASYFVPQGVTEDAPVAALMSYAWNLDSNKVRAVKDIAKSKESPIAVMPEWFGYSSEWWRALRTAGAVISAVVPRDPRVPVEGVISTYDGARGLDATGIDWQDQPGAAGGFKLDGAGDFQTTNALTYAYLRSTDPALGESNVGDAYQRIHFASESASNYGGWVEGAVMAGANAVIGILSKIDQGKLKQEPASLLRGNPFASINKLIPLKPYS